MEAFKAPSRYYSLNFPLIVYSISIVLKQTIDDMSFTFPNSVPSWYHSYAVHRPIDVTYRIQRLSNLTSFKLGQAYSRLF